MKNVLIFGSILMASIACSFSGLKANDWHFWAMLASFAISDVLWATSKDFKKESK